MIIYVTSISTSVPSGAVNFDYANLNDDIYEQPVNLMTPKKTPHEKNQPSLKEEVNSKPDMESWPSYDFSKFEAYMANYNTDEPREHNRIKRRAKSTRRFNTQSGPKLRERPHHYTYPEPVKDRIVEFTTSTKRPGILPDQMNPGVIFRRRRGRGGRRRNKMSSPVPEEGEKKNASTTEVPIARRGEETYQLKKKRKKSKKDRPNYDTYDPPIKDWEADFVEMPKDLYQAHLRPGVIFRIHMSEAILKMQYRNYGEDKDESVIEADVEYLRLTRKVVSDEITKFEDLKWLVGWFNNRSELIQEHMCNTRYYAAGIPPTMFTHPEEYMKRMCLFDNVYIDHIPYVVGEDSSLMAAVAPPVLHCDAATCTSVPFIDSLMFDERLSRTNVRTVTRCQASCRAHCRNDADCLKRCTDRCFRSD
ncbi:hypothetical protein K1T71_014575 [Dendrolimus kikuchii]|uniref:Uncharacterized protein n=1 Tax=Dendrolimus kikuchii TaxID=765133 RepID=A0ACC1CEG9_9NEOP|nr:hypothetical protein K1T71_014575 [Dendrolimus kikuchii]